MSRTRIGMLLGTALASVVAVSATARAADYHHVHLTTSNATEAVKWYERYLDCQPLADRGDAVDCRGAQVVFDSRPEVFAHNVETVPRIFKRIRPAFRYERSLDVITQARDFGLVTKSNLILGMGETREEVSQALRDLHEAGCELITITQYLRPSARHHPVERWVKPEEFVELKDEADEIAKKFQEAGAEVEIK